MTRQAPPSCAHRRRFWLSALLLAPVLAHAAEPSADDLADAPDDFDPARVEVRVNHDADVPWNRPSCRIHIARWRPHADVSLVALGVHGERIDLTPEPVVADADGSLSLDIDYERTGLTPGHWVLLVAGAGGERRVPIDVPEVEWPAGARPRFRMTYGPPGVRE